MHGPSKTAKGDLKLVDRIIYHHIFLSFISSRVSYSLVNVCSFPWCILPVYYRLVVSPEEAQNKDPRSFVKAVLIKIADLLVKAKVLLLGALTLIANCTICYDKWIFKLLAISLQTSCALSLGFGEDTINASSVLVMPMMSSRMTGFRGNGLERARILSMRNSGWSKIPMDEDAGKLLDTSSVVPPSP